MSRVVSQLLRLSQSDTELDWVRVVHAMESYLVDAGWEYQPNRLTPENHLELWACLSHFRLNPDEDRYLNWQGLDAHKPALQRIARGSSVSQDSHRFSDGRSRRDVPFTFIDLFAGIGGFHLAFAQQRGAVTFASEWDSAARFTYAINHGVVPFGDIRAFTTEDGRPLPPETISSRIPQADVISAGFPCQPFSLAGVSSRNFHGLKHGLECETQGTLFQDIILTALAANPRALILENVRNLASHDNGQTLRIIIDAIEQNGYTVFPRRPSEEKIPPSWAIQDSSRVSAQRRKRLYMVCIRTDLVEALGEFSFPVLNPKVGAPLTLREVISHDNEQNHSSNIAKFKNYSISQKLWDSHRQRDREHSIRGNGFRVGLMVDRDSKTPTLVARYYKDGKDCLIPRANDRLALNSTPRMLSPSECAILQTFPPGFKPHPSKTPAYKQFGNSITVEVATQIAGALIEYLELT